MKVLGIESTAHTFGAGVVVDGEVVSNVREMYRPEEGGIHPREAADHHVDHGSIIVKKALEKASIDVSELDLVAFSKGPGLGPCLRVGATIARVISIRNSIPILGVNHCVAHLEIGRILGAEDPVLLYASGANTQVIAYVGSRYRVMGETLDIGIGNMLDKLGREMGIPFPAGPRIEKLARGERIEGISPGMEPEFVQLPYSVKGMDMSFSGIMTAALSKWKNGLPIPSVCHSVQETCFSMLCEVSERAMAHIGSSEVLLGGGVACNDRLKEMVSIMAGERDAESFAPTPPLAVDNGAMIAYLGERMFNGGVRHELEDTVIDQRFRTDQVNVTWRDPLPRKEIRTPGTVSLDGRSEVEVGSLIGRGAEAVVSTCLLGDIQAVRKKRSRKGYRINEMEKLLRLSRTKNEGRMMEALGSSIVRTPYLLDVDPEEGELVMELFNGPRLASVLNHMEEEKQKWSLFQMGRIIGNIHSRSMVHGDLTTSNFILMEDGKAPYLGLIDMSLSERTEEVEKMGVDLRLFFEVFHSTHYMLEDLVDSFWEGYRGSSSNTDLVIRKMESIDSRGRYMS